MTGSISVIISISSFYGTSIFPPPPPSQISDPKERREAIREAFRIFKNVYVPDIPPYANLQQEQAGLEDFNNKLKPRLPLDLVVLGLGKGNLHMAFLGEGTERNLDSNAPPAKIVPLWEEVRRDKWINQGCVCSLIPDSTCELGQQDAPREALTITLETILSARQILLLVNDGKAEEMENLYFGDYNPRRFTAHYLRDVAEKVIVLTTPRSAIQL